MNEMHQNVVSRGQRTPDGRLRMPWLDLDGAVQDPAERVELTAEWLKAGRPMSDSRSPEALCTPLMIGEAYGRVEVPLPGLPEGVTAITVPRTGRDGDRVPRDRKGRVRATEVDLVARGPVEAYRPPPTLSRRELIWVLETGSRRWATIEAKFHQRGWGISVDLIRAGGVVVRCDVDVLNYVPRSWRLTHAWASQSPTCYKNCAAAFLRTPLEINC